MAETGQDWQGWASDDIDLFINVLGYDGLPLDLTDCYLEWTLGDINGEAGPLLVKTSDDPAGIEMLDIVGGRVCVHVDPPDTTGMVGNFRQELRVHDAFHGQETIMVGWVTLHPARVHPAARRAPLRVVA